MNLENWSTLLAQPLLDLLANWVDLQSETAVKPWLCYLLRV